MRIEAQYFSNAFPSINSIAKDNKNAFIILRYCLGVKVHVNHNSSTIVRQKIKITMNTYKNMGKFPLLTSS